LMAEIEEAEHGDQGRVREWMSRAMRAAGDPVWTADGVVSERWLPVSPNGRLDGYEWKLPLAEIGVTRPVIEFAPPPAKGTTPELESKPTAEKLARKSARASSKDSAKSGARAKPVEAVIPLVHAPDDPGLDSGLDVDPVPEPTLPPPRDTWQRLRQLFR
jgi:HemY protein